MQFDMVFVGQKLDSVTEVDVLLMFNIAEHVTAETTTETMPYTQRRAHGKTWRFFIVERAQPYISASSGRLERNRRGHNVIQIGGGANFFDIFLQNHSWHTFQPTSSRQQRREWSVSAEVSVRLATWSMATRRRASSSAA